MDLRQQLETSLRDSLKSGDEIKKQTIRMVLSAVKFAEIEKGKPLDDSGVTSTIQKEIKSRRESIQDAQKANRPDIIETTQKEISILETFLPKQLTEDEIRSLAISAIEEVQAKSIIDMGKVMKVIIPKIQGRAPNDQVSQIIRKLLFN
jgi:uncharacterized protein YqeY